MAFRSHVAGWGCLALALSLAFAAGSPPPGWVAVWCGVAGTLWIAFPARDPVPRPLGWACLAVIAASALAFVPWPMLPVPGWRSALQEAGVLAAGWRATPQPWLAAEGLALLAAGALFPLFLLCHRVNGEAHFRLSLGFAAGIAAYAGLSIWAVESGWLHPWAPRGPQQTFGFLANVNHVGTILAMGGVVALGALSESVARRRATLAVVAGLCLGVIAWAALFYSTSRSATPLLVGGCCLWMAGVVGKHLAWRGAILIGAVIAGALLLFFVVETPASRRISSFVGEQREQMALEAALAGQLVSAADPGSAVPFDFRLLLYRDVSRMVAEQPLSGVGLANFRYVFPRYRDVSLAENLSIHPDSSWMLALAEGGWLGFAAFAAVVGLAFARLRGCRAHPSWPVRWASAAAVCTFLVHSGFDVPAHRVASLYPALFLAALAFRRPSVALAEAPRPRFTRCAFAGAGIACWCGGATMAGWVPVPWKPPLATLSDRVKFAAYDLHAAGRTEDAIDLVRRGMERVPLAPDLHHYWGAYELGFVGTDATVEAAFRAERLLEPNFTWTPLRQAALWVAADPRRVEPLLEEAMGRARRLEQRGHPGVRARVYRASLRLAGKAPELSPALRRVAGGEPALLLDWMAVAPASEVAGALAEIVAGEPGLREWSSPERRRLFRAWRRKGDRAALLRELAAHPAWEADAWPARAAALAEERRFEEAWALVSAKIGWAVAEGAGSGGSVAERRARFAADPSAANGESLCRALLAKSDWEGVLAVAAECEAAPVARMASDAAARLGRWEEAWKHLVAAIRIEDPSSAPE